MWTVSRRSAVVALTVTAGLALWCHPAVSAAGSTRTPPAGAAGTAGTVTILGGNTSSPWAITAGPDGALWYTNESKSIGRITTSGVVSIFKSRQVSFAQDIVAGPDGALWFNNIEGQYPIGRLTTGGKFSFFSLGSGFSNLGVDDITVGPDGALWFTMTFTVGAASQSRVGRITTSGG